ncbi:GntR family transcriptional regulator [Gryllotalpicola daejeonensis]|uniref:GntR family transcriptional regulator n=1 Tax=Gryllotalpicola daejeonensis TaxID=993087 RepID=A0ABP7ZHG0_9MICO
MSHAIIDAAHREVSLDLEQRIMTGEFPPGSRLPSEEKLAQEYSTTRSRVRHALSALAESGLVSSHANAGWFVQNGRQSWGVGAMRTFSEWCASNGRAHGGRIVHRERGAATATEALKLGIRRGDQVLRYTRVRTIDDRPVMVEHSTWAPWVTHVVEGFPDDVPSVYGAMATAGVRIELGDHRIEVDAASSEDARLLGVRRSSPVLLVTRSGIVAEGLTVECSTDRYIPGLVAFDVSRSDISKAFLRGRG